MVDPDTAKLSCYFVTYSRLKLIGVTFHKVVYFDPSEILSNLPESSVDYRNIQASYKNDSLNERAFEEGNRKGHFKNAFNQKDL